MIRRVPIPNGATAWVNPNVDPVTFAPPAPADAGWIEVKKVTSPSHSGGSERFTTYTALGDYYETSVPSGRDPIDISLPVQDDSGAAHIIAIANGRDTRAPLAFRFTLPNGAHIVWSGYVSGGVIPQMDRNSLMVLNYSIRVIRMPTRIAP